MTGTLTSFASLQTIYGFNFYMADIEEPIRHDLMKVSEERLTSYERRMLFYPYLPRNNEEPLVIGYFDTLVCVKLFVPKYTKRIVPLDSNFEEMEVEGVFWDPSSASSMNEYNVDKVVELISSAIGIDLQTYFKTLHEDPLLDAHREDIEVVPGYIQPRSLVNKYMVYLSQYPKTAEVFGTALWSNDESIWQMGAKMNERDKESDFSIYPTGISAHSSLLKDDFSITYLGDMISGDNTYFFNIASDDFYRQWARDNHYYNDPKKHMQWDRFKWAPDTKK